jgi:uncharacterized LabA/DUF88 family protein
MAAWWSVKTSVYIDGFNFYYGCFRLGRSGSSRCSPADKWLNLRLLADQLALPEGTVHQVHYFTAHIHRSRRDPGQNLRQETYLRALRTVESLFIHFGSHIPVERKGMIIDPDPAALGIWEDQLVTIGTFEEKGSDVNLATRLLDDSWEGMIDRAIVVSNDTDLIAPIQSARKRIRVSVVSPQPSVAKHLKRAAETATILDTRILTDCRFPIPVIDAQGKHIYPPRTWQAPDSDGVKSMSAS